MFSLVSVADGRKYRVYSSGDIIEFTLSNGYRFKGTFSGVSERGLVKITNLSGRGSGFIGHSLQVQVGTIKEYYKGRVLDLVIVDDGAVYRDLVSARGGAKFSFGDSICVRVNKGSKKVLFEGRYGGITNNSIILRLFKHKNSDISYEKEIMVKDIDSVWFSGKSRNKYKVKVLKYVK